MRKGHHPTEASIPSKNYKCFPCFLIMAQVFRNPFDEQRDKEVEKASMSYRGGKPFPNKLMLKLVTNRGTV